MGAGYPVKLRPCLPIMGRVVSPEKTFSPATDKVFDIMFRPIARQSEKAFGLVQRLGIMSQCPHAVVKWRQEI